MDISNPSNFDEQAKQQAVDAQSQYENEIASKLMDSIEKSKQASSEAAAIRHQEVLDQIARNKEATLNKYNRDVRAAYISKEQTKLQINNDLSRLGLDSGGFGITQRILNENQYQSTVGDLNYSLNESLNDLAGQESDAGLEYNANMLELEAEYADKELENLKYVNEESYKRYTDTYNITYNALEDAYKNAFEREQFEWQKQQQEWENKMRELEYQETVRHNQASEATARYSATHQGNTYNVIGGAYGAQLANRNVASIKNTKDQAFNILDYYAVSSDTRVSAPNQFASESQLAASAGWNNLGTTTWSNYTSLISNIQNGKITTVSQVQSALNKWNTTAATKNAVIESLYFG